MVPYEHNAGRPYEHHGVGELYVKETMNLTRLSDIYSTIGSEVERFGGVLRCRECGHEIPLKKGDVAKYLAHGWPMCCDHAMRWVTQKELASSTKEN